MFAVIACYKDGKLKSAYVCANIVASDHAQTHRDTGHKVKIYPNFKTESAALARVVTVASIAKENERP